MLTQARHKGTHRAHGRHKEKRKKKKSPTLEDLVNIRDYTGAITLLDYELGGQEASSKKDLAILQWVAYCAFHLGEFKRSQDCFERLLAVHPEPDLNWHTYLGVSLFFQGEIEKAEEAALKGPATPLQTRLLFHIAYRSSNDEDLHKYHQQLAVDSVEDQLSLSAMHFLRGHYQQAVDVYKSIIADFPTLSALNVFIALCYYKQEQFDLSQERLQAYHQDHPSSPSCLILRGANTMKRTLDGKMAEQDLKTLRERAKTGLLSSPIRDLVAHNLVVFRNGEDALRILPKLIDVIPEARLNMVIWYLENDKPEEAFELVRDVEPATAQEYVLKAAVCATLGQMQIPRAGEHLRSAQELYNIVGTSQTDKDTIPGRQSMASGLFLLRQWDDVQLYLGSIRDYFTEDDRFNFNLGIASAAAGNYKSALTLLLSVRKEKLRQEFSFFTWLVRTYIANKKPQEAWEVYATRQNTPEGASLLLLIAHDCYRNGFFLVAARAFDLLNRMDPQPDHFEGMHAACVGEFQLVVAGDEPMSSLPEVLAMLDEDGGEQAEYASMVIKTWLAESGREDEMTAEPVGGERREHRKHKKHRRRHRAEEEEAPPPVDVDPEDF